jgi:hypothetical protein
LAHKGQALTLPQGQRLAAKRLQLSVQQQRSARFTLTQTPQRVTQ